MSTPVRDHFDSSNTAFQRDVKARVDAYFAGGKSRFATPGMVLKTLFYLGGTAALLGVLSAGVLPPWPALAVSLVLGALVAGIGFNVGHDAIHGAWSSNARVNALLARSFDLVGASSFYWAKAHNVLHHTYTNISGVDGDLEPGPWLLFYPRASTWRLHRYQHLYAMPLYCLTSIVWILKKDLSEALKPDLRTGKTATRLELLQLAAWKAVHFAVFLGLPLAFSGYPAWQVLVGYLAMHAVAGLCLAVVFQLAHVVEGVELRPGDASQGRLPWAEHQLRTTADFAPNSAWVMFACGGLNYQIEHHLFARICHVHYAALAPLVEEAARAHGLPYVQNSSFWSACASHLRLMKRLGRPSSEAAPMGTLEPVGAPAEG